MTIHLFTWEEIKSIFADLPQEEQEVARRVNDKLSAAVRSGSKTPLLDALEGESLELRGRLIAVGWGNIAGEFTVGGVDPE